MFYRTHLTTAQQVDNASYIERTLKLDTTVSSELSDFIINTNKPQEAITKLLDAGYEFTYKFVNNKLKVYNFSIIN
jgi:phosphopantothenoylcysteine synthetase/decarboxylase